MISPLGGRERSTTYLEALGTPSEAAVREAIFIWFSLMKEILPHDTPIATMTRHGKESAPGGLAARKRVRCLSKEPLTSKNSKKAQKSPKKPKKPV